MRRTFFRLSKSMAGMALIGLGLLILRGDVNDAAIQFSRLTGIGGGTTQTFGELTTLGLAALQVWQSYLFDRREFVRGVCRILITFWPLLLVMAGAILTGMASRTTSNNFPK
jgi:hypothetical protein